MGNYATTWCGDITSMSVKEVPTNTLVQWDLPNSYLPLWSANGVLFDGANDFLKTAPITYVRPEMIYIVFKQISWTASDMILSGNAPNLVA